MNITSQIIPVKAELVQKYCPFALKLCLGQKVQQLFSKQQKIVVSKIYKNMNILCKLTKKQLKELFKDSQFQVYKEIIGQLYFDKKINNYILISNEDSTKQTNFLHTKITSNANSPKHHNKLDQIHKLNQCVHTDFRIQFTISNIRKNKVMKPAVLIKYILASGRQISIYYSLQQFTKLRRECAEAIKTIYGIQLRTLF